MNRKRYFESAILVITAAVAMGSLTCAEAGGRRVAIDTIPDEWNLNTDWMPEKTVDLSDDRNSPEFEFPGSAGSQMQLKIGTKTYSRVWINENGFITLAEGAGQQPIEFSAAHKTLESIDSALIAPFWADINTREADLTCDDGSRPLDEVCDVTYSTLDLDPNAAVDYHRAVRVTWGYFGDSASGNLSRYAGVTKVGGDESLRIAFQVKLIDRSDLPNGRLGDFDLEFNYNGISWEDTPSLVGIKADTVLLDFSKFYPSFRDAVSAGCSSGDDKEPSFDPALPLACNSITVEFRNGHPNLKTYTADLTAQIEPSSGSLHSAEEFPLTLNVRNSNLDSATDVNATFDLPSRTTFLSVVPVGTTCTQAGSKATCLLGTLAPGETKSVMLKVASNEPGARTYAATVNAAQYDPQTSNNSTTMAVSLLASADVSVTSCNGPASAVQGTNVTVTCSVRNRGPQSALSVSLEADIPANLTFASGVGCSATGSKLTCALPTLAVDASSDISVTFNTASTGAANMSATVRASEFDPIANNRADVALSVTAKPADPPTTEDKKDSDGGGGALSLGWLFALAAVKLISRSRCARPRGIKPQSPAPANTRHKCH